MNFFVVVYFVPINYKNFEYILYFNFWPYGPSRFTGDGLLASVAKRRSLVKGCTKIFNKKSKSRIAEKKDKKFDYLII